MGEAATAPPVPKRHCCEPSCSATAYTLWSSEPKYATPSLRAGVDHTLSPVVKRQRWEPSSASSAYRLPSDVPTTTRPSATAGPPTMASLSGSTHLSRPSSAMA